MNFAKVFREHLFCRTCALGCFWKWMCKNKSIINIVKRPIKTDTNSNKLLKYQHIQKQRSETRFSVTKEMNY